MKPSCTCGPQSHTAKSGCATKTGPSRHFRSWRRPFHRNEPDLTGHTYRLRMALSEVRMALIPIVLPLVGVRDSQQLCFIECPSNQLQADGQTLTRKSAGHGNRGESREICRATHSDKRGAHADFFAVDRNVIRAN